MKLATEESDNPDLRDRAYIYWRMLSTSPQNTKYVVLGEKPNLADDSYNTYDNALVSSLINSISTLSSIYHKTPEEIASQQKKAPSAAGAATPSASRKEEEEEEEPQQEAKEEKKAGKKPKRKESPEEEIPQPVKKSKKTKEPVETPQPAAAPVQGLIDIDDLLGMGDS